jgi:hypothetical protein
LPTRPRRRACRRLKVVDGRSTTVVMDRRAVGDWLWAVAEGSR